MMGKHDHDILAAHRAGHSGAALFDSLKQVWLSSVHRPRAAAATDAAAQAALPELIVVSKPPPARVLP